MGRHDWQEIDPCEYRCLFCKEERSEWNGEQYEECPMNPEPSPTAPAKGLEVPPRVDRVDQGHWRRGYEQCKSDTAAIVERKDREISALHQQIESLRQAEARAQLLSSQARVEELEREVERQKRLRAGDEELREYTRGEAGNCTEEEEEAAIEWAAHAAWPMDRAAVFGYLRGLQDGKAPRVGSEGGKSGKN